MNPLGPLDLRPEETHQLLQAALPPSVLSEAALACSLGG